MKGEEVKKNGTDNERPWKTHSIVDYDDRVLPYV